MGMTKMKMKTKIAIAMTMRMMMMMMTMMLKSSPTYSKCTFPARPNAKILY
jgi:hypothetical protein